MSEIFRSSYAKLPAQDVERARAFYRDVLGFEPVRENHGHLFYECGGGSLLVEGNLVSLAQFVGG